MFSVLEGPWIKLFPKGVEMVAKLGQIMAFGGEIIPLMVYPIAGLTL